MAIIKFTRLEYGGGVVKRKYGTFWYEASKQGLSVHGRMTMVAHHHGDAEIRVMGEEFAAVIGEAVLKSPKVDLPPSAWMKRGAGLHPKAGPYVAYQAPGLVVKVTGAMTEFLCKPVCQVPTEACAGRLLTLFDELLGDRDLVRTEHARWRKGIAI